MFNFLKKKPRGEKIQFKIDGMHCTSCSMNIDGELEDTKGVISAHTSYAQAKTTIEYDSSIVNKDELAKVIEKLEYRVSEL